MSIEKLIAVIPSQSKAQRDQMRANARSRLVSGKIDVRGLLATPDALETA